MRTSLYKKQILKLLQKKHLLTIAEIHKELPKADFSTICRNIEKLLADGEIKKVIVNNKNVSYEAAENSHDHFICNDCGKIESIQVGRHSIRGVRIDDITVRGLCGKCKD